jgi:hypothetical protein
MIGMMVTIDPVTELHQLASASTNVLSLFLRSPFILGLGFIIIPCEESNTGLGDDARMGAKAGVPNGKNTLVGSIVGW